MINHISRQIAGVRGLPTARTALAIRRPVHHARQGLAATADPPADRSLQDLPSQARHSVLDDHDRGDRRNGTYMDLVRHGRLVRTDRPRRHRTSDTRPDHRLAALLASRRPHRPPRCRRICDQEAGNELLHGRARDLRVPRVDHQRRQHPPTDPSPGSARPLHDPPTTVGHGLLDLRLRVAGTAPPRLLHRPSRPTRRPPCRSPNGSSRRSTATTGSRSTPTSTDARAARHAHPRRPHHRRGGNVEPHPVRRRRRTASTCIS